MELNLLVNTIKNIVSEDTQVDIQNVQKGNVILTGITIGKGNIRPVVYVEHYEDLFNVKGYLEVAKKMIEICEDVSKDNMDFDIDAMTTWEYAKENLMLCIAPAGTNQDIVTVPYLDLELYFRVKVKDGTYKVKEHMLQLWGITVAQLLDIASENKYTVTSMMEKMFKLMEMEEYIEEMKDAIENDTMTILTNEDGLYGASAIYNKEILKGIADKHESDLYIMPSSIHEVLLTPTKIGSLADMSEMVKSVNETEVAPDEILSDHVYIFHRDTMEIDW